MGDTKDIFKVGSRKSELALIQTNLVINLLQKEFPEKKFEIVTMLTLGDQILEKPLPKIGEKSLFTKELETALEKKEVDFVVHSLKDLPTVLPNGLTIGAVVKREDPRDAVIMHPKLKASKLENLPKESVIGTSSLRRAAQLTKKFPDLIVENIRGNLNTRLRKLDQDNKYSGIILAAAGIHRMKWNDRISQILEPSEMLYAVGQGALAVECRTGDYVVMQALQILNHTDTILRIIAERSFLKTLGGGCSAPVAVATDLTDGSLSLTGAVWSLDGSKSLQETRCGIVFHQVEEPPRKQPHLEDKAHTGITATTIDKMDLDTAEDLGKELALSLIKEGALDIIQEAKKSIEKPEGLVALKDAVNEINDRTVNMSNGSDRCSTSDNNNINGVDVEVS